MNTTNGFTLIEMMITLAIVVILITTGLGAMEGINKSTQSTSTPTSTECESCNY